MNETNYLEQNAYTREPQKEEDKTSISVMSIKFFFWGCKRVGEIDEKSFIELG